MFFSLLFVLVNSRITNIISALQSQIIAIQVLSIFDERRRGSHLTVSLFRAKERCAAGKSRKATLTLKY